MPRGRSVRTNRARAKFLENLARTANVSESAAKAGMSRRAAYDWKADDEEFAAAWADALEQATDSLEAEARKRAVDGWDEPVFQNGALVGHKRKYSDRMLEILLKGHRPGKFVERRQVEHSGKNGGPITLQQLVEAVDAEEPEDE